MPPDEAAEDWLRRVLRDPRWSLPPWPDAEARVRRAARRQRVRAAGVGLGTGAAVIAAIVVPLALLPGAPTRPGSGIGPGSSPSATIRPHARRHPALALPAVGAAGFPARIYPPPASRKELNLVGLCPNPSGLQPVGRGSAAPALRVIKNLGRSFRSDLRLSDRSFWPEIKSGWQPGGTPIFPPPKQSGRLPVLFSGPLLAYHQAFGPPDMSHTILAGCGSRTARDTWMIVIGPVKEPAVQGEFLLLDRRGHLLVWNAQ